MYAGYPKATFEDWKASVYWSVHYFIGKLLRISPAVIACFQSGANWPFH